MEFAKIITKLNNKGVMEVAPDFRVTRGSDLMVRGHAFYSIFNEETQLWEKDEFEVSRMVDIEMERVRNDILEKAPAQPISVKYLHEYSNGKWREYKRLLKDHPDNYHVLDQKVMFANSPVGKKDYASFRLTYPLEEGPITAYDKLVSRLYSPEERQKFEWAIGSIIAGDSKTIQKFLVFYGEPASGKSTVLGIIRKLFDGYCSVFDSKTLASHDSFALDFFEKDPLVAIQEDGDLSKIEDNTTLNSIISHEVMRVNSKYKTPYESRANCMLFMGTNNPVQITDIKSGLIRRLILVTPTNNPHPIDIYEKLMAGIEFELGHIAAHCLRVYKTLGRSYYNGYRATEMIERTNPFYNFVRDNYNEFTNGINLTDAYTIYKIYCEASNYKTVMTRYRFRDELKGYFKEFHSQKRINGQLESSWYEGLLYEKIGINNINDLEKEIEESPAESKFTFLEQASRFDTIAREYPAQEATKDGLPKRKWVNCHSLLKDIDTHKLHFVKVPSNHIIIDFDIRGPSGEKDLKANLEAIQKWPLTYAELSKSGSGIHLHYIYDGDPSELSSIYSENVEIKVYTGDASLRRQLTLCNDAEIAHISSGLPLKEVNKDVIKEKTIKSEASLRKFILRNLRKEYMGYTAPSVSLIKEALDNAYNSGMHYDVSDMFEDVRKFASASHNQAQKCLGLVGIMKFKSESSDEDTAFKEEDPLVFFDLEVFPNVLIVCWKFHKEDKVYKLINPTPSELAPLLKMKLIGFNNRLYDNHILYAALMGYSNLGLYKLSSKLVSNDKHIQKMARFAEAYNWSYTDVFDFASAQHKMSLKKWEIKLNIAHVENAHPWDQPLEEKYWQEVADYCANDVKATEAVFEAIYDDYLARVILAKIAGMTPNATTNSLTEKIIFEGNGNPQDTFNYPNLADLFPGYIFDEECHNIYRGENVGFGGYVYAVPGMYGHSKTFDVASMHPSSIIAMNLFGDYYTARYKSLKDSRIAIKHGDLEFLKNVFDGIFMEFVDFNDKKSLKALSNALKTALNSVYGLTSAGFPNAFKDPRNVNNVVALRGALFMVTLKDEVIKRGYKVIHIKTDSIKIENPDEAIEKFIFDFGKKYGYDFEVEDEFEKLCLLNDAVLVEKLVDGTWQTVGKEFAEPYVKKTLLTSEEIIFEDLIQVRSVKNAAIYLNFNEEDESVDRLIFVGRIGGFVPILPGRGGGLMQQLRNGADKLIAVTGSKGFRWNEAEVIKKSERMDDIDFSYFNQMVNSAYAHLGEFCNEKFPTVEEFVA